ncbi:hypothetical protein UT4_18940 [Ferrigenium sp. UT4]
MKIKQIARDALIVVLVTVGLLVALELVLRVSFPELAKARSAPTSVAFQYNSKYLVALKPNIVKEYTNSPEDGGATIVWKTNSLGFRGDEIGDKRGVRVIVYGDSNVHARFSPDEETYPAQLQKMLRQKWADAQVINAGMTGSGPDQSLLRLQEDFERVKPDVVVFHIFADNDYGDLIKNRLFKLSGNGELVETGFPPTVDPKLASWGPAIGNAFRHWYLQGAVNRLIARAAAAKTSSLSENEKVERSLQLLEENNALAYVPYRENKPREFSHFKDFYDIDIATHPQSESARTKIALMGKILEAASRFCATKNIRFMVVVQPSMIDMTTRGYGAFAPIGYTDLAKKYPKYKPANLTDPLKQICLRERLSCVHLIDSYRQHDPEHLYISDGHWNGEGQRIAAEETAKNMVLPH